MSLADPHQREDLLAELRDTVGPRYVLTGEQQTRRFRKGWRCGEGKVLAVVQPGTLLEQWHALQAAVASDCIVIMQAANTGLTGGSTPDGDDYDRDIVLISTRRLAGVQLINEGKQTICLPGATLDRLEQALAPLGREPHSVIGSSCIGASVLGGVCNNSGGALVRRGPAYTELALYAQVQADGRLTLVNHLGIELGDSPEDILTRLQNGDYRPEDVRNESAKASDNGYADKVREVDADTPARFNADPSRLFEASGSAGKLCLFAVRLDTFVKEPSTVFYIGTNDPQDLTELRRDLLTQLPSLPIAGEYIHRTAFDIGERYEHHLLLRVADNTAEHTREYLSQFFGGRDSGDFFECDEDTGRRAFLHRFAIAGAAVRYREVHRREVEDIVALDIALRRNDREWVETLPDDLERDMVHKLYYGHFFCHVFHQDYIVRKGVDPLDIEHRMWALLDERRAEYPAEHNVGHLYVAKPALAGFYRKLDPTNSFNPGIGHTSRQQEYH